MAPDYTLQLNSKERGEYTVPLVFNAFALRHFSRLIGVELDDLYIDLSDAYKRSKGEEVTTQAKAFKREFLPEFLLAGHIAHEKYNARACSSTDVDACQWLDDMGGYLDAQTNEAWAACFARMVNVDPSALIVEKKTIETESPSPGIGG